MKIEITFEQFLQITLNVLTFILIMLGGFIFYWIWRIIKFHWQLAKEWAEDGL